MADKDKELEDLEAMVAAPGWQIFKDHAAKEWGARAYRQKAQQILGKLTSGQTTEAASHLLQLESSAREVELLFAWVDDQISKLRHMREQNRAVTR